MQKLVERIGETLRGCWMVSLSHEASSEPLLTRLQVSKICVEAAYASERAFDTKVDGVAAGRDNRQNSGERKSCISLLAAGRNTLLGRLPVRQGS